MAGNLLDVLLGEPCCFPIAIANVEAFLTFLTPYEMSTDLSYPYTSIARTIAFDRIPLNVTILIPGSPATPQHLVRSTTRDSSHSTAEFPPTTMQYMALSTAIDSYRSTAGWCLTHAVAGNASASPFAIPAEIQPGRQR